MVLQIVIRYNASNIFYFVLSAAKTTLYFAVSQTIWISDGCHSVHMFTAMDIENALNEADGNDCNEKLLRLPGSQTFISFVDLIS